LEQDLRDPQNLARFCAETLDEKKIADLEIFDVDASTSLASCFVIGTGLNARHIQSAADHLGKSLRERGVARHGLEGYREGKWLLLDAGDVVVHLFLEETRRFYDLELLWGDAPRLEALPSRRRSPAAP
jgi:ribosome-associated protein